MRKASGFWPVLSLVAVLGFAAYGATPAVAADRLVLCEEFTNTG